MEKIKFNKLSNGIWPGCVCNRVCDDAASQCLILYMHDEYVIYTNMYSVTSDVYHKPDGYIIGDYYVDTNHINTVDNTCRFRLEGFIDMMDIDNVQCDFDTLIRNEINKIDKLKKNAIYGTRGVKLGEPIDAKPFLEVIEDGPVSADKLFSITDNMIAEEYPDFLDEVNNILSGIGTEQLSNIIRGIIDDIIEKGKNYKEDMYNE